MNAALAGLVILAIGDSQMMHMMSNLHSELEDAGATVHSYSMCGATAGDWLYPSTITSCGRSERHGKGPVVAENQKAVPTYSLPRLIEEYHPNLIVVELGDTMAGYGQPQMDRSWILPQVRALTGKIAASGIACDWVGPIWGQNAPPYRKDDARVREIAQLLSQSVAPCKYVDSTNFARPGEWPTKDGTHLLPDGYRRWATALTNTIVQLNGQKVVSAR